MAKCDTCKTDKPESGFSPTTWKRKARGGWGSCRSCLAEKFRPADACRCMECRWFEDKAPLNRWRTQACRVLGISSNWAKALDVAQALADLNGEERPKCNGQAFAYMALKYDGRFEHD